MPGTHLDVGSTRRGAVWWVATMLPAADTKIRILTTNRGVASWGDIFSDTTIAAAMLDRLLHRSVVFNNDGDSYRLRAHQARNQHLRTKGAND